MAKKIPAFDASACASMLETIPQISWHWIAHTCPIARWSSPEKCKEFHRRFKIPITGFTNWGKCPSALAETCKPATRRVG